MSLVVAVLAAGKGTRMCSDLPKVLHSIGGKPMLHHVIDSVDCLSPQCIHVVVEHGFQSVIDSFTNKELFFSRQPGLLGTGDALMQVLPKLNKQDRLLVLFGDCPLIQLESLEGFLNSIDNNALGVITTKVPVADGYGRICRNKNDDIISIVEHKDATDDLLKIKEINSGIMCGPVGLFEEALGTIENNNSQGEYYLTDVVKYAVDRNIKVQGYCLADYKEVQGINSREQLVQAEKYYQNVQRKKLLRAGVHIYDESTFILRGNLICGKDVFIDTNVIVEGDVVLGDRVHVGPFSVIKNCIIGDDVEVKSHSSLEGAKIGKHSKVGPFARLREGCELSINTKVGNFVELKKVKFGDGSKVSHLSYLGDSEIGSGVNVGAGAITCNYDGKKKHKTKIEDNVFVGSNCSLIAPVNLGEGAVIGAGTVLVKDAAKNKVTVNKIKQIEISDVFVTECEAN